MLYVSSVLYTTSTVKAAAGGACRLLFSNRENPRHGSSVDYSEVTLKICSVISDDWRNQLTTEPGETDAWIPAARQYLSGADMGTIKCTTCPGEWTVSTAKAEAIIAQNHTYLNPGHRTATVWEETQDG